MNKPNIKVKINYPETKEGMRRYEEIKVESYYKILKEILSRDCLKMLLKALKNEDIF
ncbi:hypothetical protein [Clostridium sp. UBA4548]|uniref:hypothetical protein n=1 Tax=Clostridium sp. UBA4548 TaxID=1946361 RepID=UPI0025C60944|nr:hypothetical protein [Clostridium sp. UBA4548]